MAWTGWRTPVGDNMAAVRAMSALTGATGEVKTTAHNELMLLTSK